MVEIIRVYEQAAPACRFIGLRYPARAGGYAAQWEEWFQAGRTEALTPLLDEAWRAAFPEAGSLLGLMRLKGDALLEYWIGLCLPPSAEPPEGFGVMDLGPARLGVCWVKGREPDVYHAVGECLSRMAQAGLRPAQSPDGEVLLLERYQHPRFTRPDTDGQRILDVLAVLEDAAPVEASLEVPADTRYCAKCRAVFQGSGCPACGNTGTNPLPDDPVLLGELPASLRNAMQIAFQAAEIPFTAMPTLGLGFTMAAGVLFETYKVYVPFERLAEARTAFDGVLAQRFSR